jgi:Toprim-like
MTDDELEQFKKEISLIELARCYGYTLEKSKSSRMSTTMSHSDGDKVIVTCDTDGHDVFFSVREDGHHGSVVDFVMYRERVNLGSARKILRRYLVPGALSSDRRPEATTRGELASLYEKWLKMQPYAGGYLEYRGLSSETIILFESRIRVDERGNVAFRHDGLRDFSGWELKNRGFTGFCAGGRKGLFIGRVGTPGPAPLVVLAESAIDAMSYYQMKPQPGYYLSLAGAISRQQLPLLAWVVDRQRAGKIIIATDNDAQGEDYAVQIRQIRSDAERDRPTVGKDWNDTLNNRDKIIQEIGVDLASQLGE